MLTQDPIGLAGGVNLYEYAGSNPVAFDDPYGLMPWPVVVRAVALVAAAGRWAAAKGHQALNAARTLLEKPAVQQGVARADAAAKAVDDVVQGAGGHISTAVELSNKAGLSQTQAISAVTQVVNSVGGRGIGGVVQVADGAKVILPRVGGPNAPIVQVGADGTARLGTAAVRFAVENGKAITSVTDINLR